MPPWALFCLTKLPIFVPVALCWWVFKIIIMTWQLYCIGGSLLSVTMTWLITSARASCFHLTQSQASLYDLLVLLTFLLRPVIKPRPTVGDIKRCCDPAVRLSVSFSNYFTFARWRYARFAVSHIFDRGQHGRKCPHPNAMSLGSISVHRTIPLLRIHWTDIHQVLMFGRLVIHDMYQL